MQPVRSAIDHVLTLVGDSPLADVLVLRGSVTMLAWAGADARDPGDLDFVVRPVAVNPQDRWWPYPYVDNPARLRTDPETVHRTARDELWAADDLEAEGRRAVLPPEGLRWLREDDLDGGWPHLELVDLIRDDPAMLLDADGAHPTRYGYTYPGARLSVPIVGGGALQIDFAYDELLPEPPVLTAIPRADGGLTALWTASPRLSLRWKLQWLAADQATGGRVAGKDLYDAVLLAELLDGPLPEVLRGLVDPGTLTVEHHPALAGGAAAWLDRLSRALVG